MRFFFVFEVGPHDPYRGGGVFVGNFLQYVYRGIFKIVASVTGHRQNENRYSFVRIFFSEGNGVQMCLGFLLVDF